MVFCSKCGTKNEDGANVCVSCGAPLALSNGSALMNQQSQMMSNMGGMQAVAQQRQDSINEVNRMHAYFSQKQNEYNEYDKLNADIPGMMHVWFVPMLVIGIIVTIIGFASVFSGSFASMLVVLVGAGLIAGFIAINVYRKKSLDENLNRVADLSNELAEHYAGYGMCLVGPEYTNPSIISAIKDVIVAGRADTPKEAINVLLDDHHKSNMEALATQTAVNSAAAARGAKTAAAFAAANFFFG